MGGKGENVHRRKVTGLPRLDDFWLVKVGGRYILIGALIWRVIIWFLIRIYRKRKVIKQGIFFRKFQQYFEKAFLKKDKKGYKIKINLYKAMLVRFKRYRYYILRERLRLRSKPFFKIYIYGGRVLRVWWTNITYFWYLLITKNFYQRVRYYPKKILFSFVFFCILIIIIYGPAQLLQLDKILRLFIKIIIRVRFFLINLAYIFIKRGNFSIELYYLDKFVMFRRRILIDFEPDGASSNG